MLEKQKGQEMKNENMLFKRSAKLPLVSFEYLESFSM